MLRRLILLRHSVPAVCPDQPASLWPLSDQGRRAAVQMRSRLPVADVLASSPEVKALETMCSAADVLPSAVHRDQRFAEVSRPGEPFDDDFKNRRLAWVTGRPDERHSTWESPDEAARRFQAGIDGLKGETAVVASHGMVITAWLTKLGLVAAGKSAGDLWTRLGSPDLIDVPVG